MTTNGRILYKIKEKPSYWKKFNCYVTIYPNFSKSLFELQACLGESRIPYLLIWMFSFFDITRLPWNWSEIIVPHLFIYCKFRTNQTKYFSLVSIFIFYNWNTIEIKIWQPKLLLDQFFCLQKSNNKMQIKTEQSET